MFQSTIYDNEMIAHVGSVISSLPGSDTRLQEIIKAQEEDPVCSQRFSHFAKEWRIKQTRNSPKYSQKSGEVKREFRTGSEQPAHKKNGLDKILFRHSSREEK